MSSVYPSGLDSLTTSKSGGDALTGHAALHDLTGDAINKIEAELGLLPKGSSATVSARLGIVAAGRVATFARSGTLTVAGGTGRFLAPFTMTVSGVIAAVNTAPTGSSILVDVNKNGTTMFTTQANRPSIAAAAFKTASTAVPDVTTLAAGDYITVDIDQIGSTVAGADLVVQVIYSVP